MWRRKLGLPNFITGLGIPVAMGKGGLAVTHGASYINGTLLPVDGGWTSGRASTRKGARWRATR